MLGEIFYLVLNMNLASCFVIAVLFLLPYTLYALICKELKKSIIHIKDNIYYSDALISPILIGILRSKIILPPGFDPDSTLGKMVLTHENVHRKRFDNLWRTLAIGIACIHWFNPMVWIRDSLKIWNFPMMKRYCDGKSTAPMNAKHTPPPYCNSQRKKEF